MAGLIQKKNQAKLAEKIYRSTHCKYYIGKFTKFKEAIYQLLWLGLSMKKLHLSPLSTQST